MCLILFAYEKHPKYKLIVAANRDEFYARDTKPADFWDDHPYILAGRDLEAGGTWMGVNKKGEVSMLTNYRDLSNIRPDAPSRGKLVSDFLKNNDDPQGYLQKIEQSGKLYNGFNIICGNKDGLWYYGNYQTDVHQIEPGIHGLSNALLNTPWPKVMKGKERFSSVISADNFDHEDLLDTLYDDIKAPKEQLPDTGVGLEKEHMLSPMFIKSENYGSRCSTVLLLDYDNNLSLHERTYDVNTYAHDTRSFEFKV